MPSWASAREGASCGLKPSTTLGHAFEDEDEDEKRQTKHSPQWTAAVRSATHGSFSFQRGALVLNRLP